MKFVAVPEYQNSIGITLKRAITQTSPYEPQLAHSTELPKPPGYNLEWSRITPIQDTLVARPPVKASHAARRNLAPDRLAGITHRQAPRTTVPSQYRHRLADTTTPPSALPRRHRLAHPPPVARHPAPTVTIVTGFWHYRLAACLAPPGAIPVAHCYWFFLALFSGLKRPPNIPHIIQATTLIFQDYHHI